MNKTYIWVEYWIHVFQPNSYTVRLLIVMLYDVKLAQSWYKY